jgi:hypothetical protein
VSLYEVADRNGEMLMCAAAVWRADKYILRAASPELMFEVQRAGPCVGFICVMKRWLLSNVLQTREEGVKKQGGRERTCSWYYFFL